MVKNLPACRKCKRYGLDSWVGNIPWRKQMATHSTILSWRIPWKRSLENCSPCGLESCTGMKWQYACTLEILQLWLQTATVEWILWSNKSHEVFGFKMHIAVMFTLCSALLMCHSGMPKNECILLNLKMFSFWKKANHYLNL